MVPAALGRLDKTVGVLQTFDVMETRVPIDRPRALTPHFHTVVIDRVVAGGDNDAAVSLEMCRGKITFFRAAQADVDTVRPFVLNSTRHGLLKRLAGQAHVSAHDNRFWFEKTGIGPAYAVSDIFVKFFAQLATNVVGFKTG